MPFAKKTKIVCTIGPATETEEKLTALLNAGMNVMRLNFSHGDFEEHGRRVKNFRAAMKKTGIPGAILQDLSGPKIRIGDFYQERVQLKPGSTFTLYTGEKIVGDETKAWINYPNLTQELKPGNMVLVDDGKKRLEVTAVKKDRIVCKVIIGGDTKGRRGVNLPGAYLKISSITEKDRNDLKFGIQHNVDYIALSFVRRPEDILELRKLLEKAKSQARIIAKIETEEAIDNIEAIVAVTDGVMVARGDLAIEIPAEKVPLIQKRIIKMCNALGKPVITATQMLESMIKSPVPTRAEVSDVANAILDGTDAIMLSEETTLGEYPVEAVQVMTRIANEVEHQKTPRALHEVPNTHLFGDSISGAAVHVANEVGAKLIVGLTATGKTSRMISRFKPQQHIIAATPDDKAFALSVLSYGVRPLKVRSFKTVVESVEQIKKALVKEKLAQKGDIIVIAAGVPFGKSVDTNMVMAETV
jgi:pyruvate kinase